MWASDVDEVGKADGDDTDAVDLDERIAALEHKLEDSEAKLGVLRGVQRKTRAELAALRRETERRLARLEGRLFRAAIEGEAA